MSDATRFLIMKADEIAQTAIARYDRTVKEALAERDHQLDKVIKLKDSAILVCDHNEELETPRIRRTGTHGRDEERYIEVTCTICGKLLREIG